MGGRLPNRPMPQGWKKPPIYQGVKNPPRPQNIIRLKNPLEFGAAYADYYKTARGGNDSRRLASSAVSTWIAKHDYESNEGTADNESKVYIGAMRSIKK